ncbi:MULTISPECIES: hypothetical protein [Rhodoplanes]|uniref:hypothetical protein n=1 Tax=Rhodoplanes TaxID=29407 RepID=UPI001331B6BC|nr:hypothetical protein [Rhodoplanes serenus]
MSSFRDLINAYGLADFADDVGVQPNTAKQMRQRNSVAPEYWDAWVRGARRRGLDITLEKLAQAAAHRRSQARATERAAS